MPTFPGLLRAPSISTRVNKGPNVIGGAAPVYNDRVEQTIVSAADEIAQTVHTKVEQAEVGNLVAQFADFEAKQSVKLRERATNAIPDGEGGFIENPKGDTWADEYIEDFDGHLTELGKNLITDKARGYFFEHQAGLKARFYEKVSLAKSSISAKKSELQVNKMLESFSVQAFNEPENFSVVANNFKSSMIEMVRAKKLSPLAAEELMQEKMGVFAESAILGEIDRNYAQAKRNLKSGKWDPFIDGKQKAQYLSRIDGKISAAESKAATVEGYRLSNPWKYAKKTGAHPGRLDILNIDSDSAADRFSWVQEYRGSIRNKQMPMFDPQEIAQFKNDISKMPPQMQVQVLSNLNEQFSQPEMRREFGASVFSDSPELAASFAIAKKQPVEAEYIVAGRALRKSKSATIPNSNKFREQFDAVVPTSVLYHVPPEIRQSYYQSAVDHYIGRLGAEGGLNEDVDSRQMKRSIESVLGPILDKNGFKTLSFVSERDNQHVDEDRFDELTQIVNDRSELEKIMGDIPRDIKGNDARLDKRYDDLEYLPAADGIYYLVLDRRMLLDKKGKPYRLNLKKVDELNWQPKYYRTRKSASNFNIRDFVGLQ